MDKDKHLESLADLLKDMEKSVKTDTSISFICDFEALFLVNMILSAVLPALNKKF